MQFIDKHKASIITFLIMGIVILSLYNISMIKKQKEQAEILMEIPEEFLAEQEQEELKEEPLAEETRQLDNARRTHSAYNEDFEDHDEVEQRIKSLLESDESSAGDEAPETQGEAALEEEKDEIAEVKKEKEKLEEGETNNRNSSLTYALKDRKAIDLPNPVYTCNGSGKVVVKIEVNKNGYVVDAKVDKRKSNTRNECLFDNAMNYARQALFSKSELEEQEGIITYFFNYSE